MKWNVFLFLDEKIIIRESTVQWKDARPTRHSSQFKYDYVYFFLF